MLEKELNVFYLGFLRSIFCIIKLSQNSLSHFPYSHPKPFPCKFMKRSTEASTMIFASWIWRIYIYIYMLPNALKPVGVFIYVLDCLCTLLLISVRRGIRWKLVWVTRSCASKIFRKAIMLPGWFSSFLRGGKINQWYGKIIQGLFSRVKRAHTGGKVNIE